LHLARIHEKTANQRKDWFWKLSHELCRKHNVICLETLNIRAMQKLWGKKISDLGFAEFVNILGHVALKYDTKLQFVDRFFASSKTCFDCGEKYTDLHLSDREWICPYCGKHHHRDTNAAKNILREGVLSWERNVRPSTASSWGCSVDTRNPQF